MILDDLVDRKASNIQQGLDQISEKNMHDKNKHNKAVMI